MIIDANVLFGFEREYHKDLRIETTLSLMQEKDIDKGIITNCKCKYYDFSEGNLETYEVLKKYSQFLGYAGFHPSQFVDVLSELEKAIFEYGLCGVRVFNTYTGFISEWGGGLDSLFMERVFASLEKWDTVVFIEGGVPFQTIQTIALRHPQLPIIASGTGYGNMGDAICAAQDCKNVYLEISTLDTMDGIGVLAEHVGAEQLVFGTGMPYNCPSAELNMVRYAHISKQDQQAIFSDNLVRILKNGGR